MRANLFPESNRSMNPRRLFLVLVILGFALRAGYGVARYRSNLVRLSGESFITSWDFDALEHVLIAKALLSGRGYIVDDTTALHGKHVRFVGEDAIFKAPLYEFFLAWVFRHLWIFLPGILSTASPIRRIYQRIRRVNRLRDLPRYASRRSRRPAGRSSPRPREHSIPTIQ